MLKNKITRKELLTQANKEVLEKWNIISEKSKKPLTNSLPVHNMDAEGVSTGGCRRRTHRHQIMFSPAAPAAEQAEG